MIFCAALLVASATTSRSVAGERTDVSALGILWSPDAGDEWGAVGVVIALHEAGIDHRSWRYGDQITAAGIAVLHLELADISADGSITGPPPDDIAVALARLTMALDRLDEDARFAHAPVGLLAFGGAGRAAMLAAADSALRDRIGALALLYPGCATLADSLETAGIRPHAPVLLLNGDADPANSPAACSSLADRLARSASVRHIQYAGAGYAWDLPPYGEQETLKLPWPHRPGAVIAANFWQEAAELSATQVASFFAAALPAQEP